MQLLTLRLKLFHVWLGESIQSVCSVFSICFYLLVSISHFLAKQGIPGSPWIFQAIVPRSHGSFEWGVAFRTQDLGTRCTHYHWGIIASRLFHWTEQGYIYNIRFYIWNVITMLHSFKCVCVYMYVCVVYIYIYISSSCFNSLYWHFKIPVQYPYPRIFSSLSPLRIYVSLLPQWEHQIPTALVYLFIFSIL